MIIILKTIKQFYKENNKKALSIYIILRFLVLLCMLLELIHRNWNNVFLCLLTLILFTIPYLIDRKFKIELPNTLETTIYLFIFSAEILGEIQNFYGIFQYWDTILHTLNGFLSAAVGFALIDILNQNEKFHFNLSPAFVALVAFCFSMTVGVLWEFFEFSMDISFHTDMQKDRVVSCISSVTLNSEKKNAAVIVDNIEQTTISSRSPNGDILETIIEGGYLDIGLIDTMKDLLVNFIGAVAFSIIGLLYIKNRDEYRFAENFIPTKRENKNS